MKVGLLGGSFDPVHAGHLKLAAASVQQLKLSRLYAVLSPRSPFKTRQKPASLHHRLKMLQLALKNKKKFRVGTWEIKMPKPSYTVASLKYFKKKHPNDQLFLIMGSDTWKGFGGWKNPREISRLARIVVGRRPGTKTIKVAPVYRESVVVLKGSFPSISSSQIRASLRSGRSMKKLVAPRVSAYIKKRKIYV